VKLPRLPITARVPLIVTLFMIAVSTFASERVLSRLIDTQTRQIEALADTHLNGLALALVDAIVREDVWQVFDVLDRSRHRSGEIQPIETVVADADGFVIASSDPTTVASQVKVPRRYIEALPSDRTMAVAANAERAYVRREVLYENLRIGSIYAALDIAPLLVERRSVLWTLILTNMMLTLLLAGAAWLIVARMMHPVRLLTSHLERSHAGHVEPIPELAVESAAGDYKRPFAAFNKLAAAVAEREALHVRLAEEERLASLGRLASGMAHEINNPLGGLFNAIDTLKRHGGDASVRQNTIDLIDRGLKGIRDVVRAALMSYRAEREDRPLHREDIEDLRLLIAPEAHRRGVFLRWYSELAGTAPHNATTVRQILLNLVLNACEATPNDGWVAVSVIERHDGIVLQVDDEGPGIPPSARAMLMEQGSRPAPIGRGTGLGLWMTNRLIRELAGTSSVEARPQGGTRVTVTIPLKQEMELGHVA
jgi:two-component system, OmpR family, sensor kinase